ncbi:MAG: hypothetical protein JJ861_03240 [Rhizobiales bacterium]|nr:hypothetical protein [Hyphomicrobiales bacterium]MBO6698608.1 hypothetical protein [Hyphomicrobiales bacterium]MBO6911054.1 hypothetical protein [Hyphomicrobiales bacterium]
MTGSSTTTMPMSSTNMARRNNPQPQNGGTRTSVRASGTVTKDGEDARQGERSSRMIYVLTASVLLLLIVYALIGVFSDTVLVTDLSAPTAGDAAVPGPSEAQETIITDRQ